MDTDLEIQARLTQAAQTPVLMDYPMARECTYQLGGKARFYCIPQTQQALKECLLVCQQVGLAFVILGGGANLLFRDNGYPGVVISTKKLDQFSLAAPGQVRVGAGLANAALSDQTLTHALTGFEWASGLPGTIGGGVYMNAKCYGSCFSEIVLEVQAITPAGDWVTLSNPECGFGYKQSLFQQQPYVITEVLLALYPGELSAIRTRTQENLEDRKRKGQFLFPSAGCVFKNNYSVGIPSGALIESCGLKGRQVGRVQVFEQHANFLVNLGQGQAQEVLELMEIIEKAVWEKYHVRLEPELRILP